ncbi:MAG TPA: efflux transporter outer membrane subunit [Anaerohalosphaeraceae bacterium]|nr:efflux transporter outer membrane subunit [Anaerohalosphaeraceae bacterium]HOL88851.1 efflux transporter outer membrane subunit [Anaerohalosphaeraceae bacterium]HPP55693.1 efflux transporter outer membrane subunit [Anaerohalosphaeraceae bacterium]
MMDGRTRKKPSAAGLGVLTAVLCCLGCRQPVSPSVPLEIPQQFSQSGTAPLPEKWWESFHDPLLTALIEEALGNNFTIRSAWDRLRQAEEAAVQAGASLFPAVQYSGEAARTRREVSNQTQYTSEYSVGLTASYEADLWGRVRSARQAALLDAQAARDDLAAAAVSLSAAAAQTWYRLVEARLQAALLKEQLRTNEKVLEIVRMQFGQGQGTAADVLRQRQLVEATRGQLIEAEKSIVLFEYQLAVLLGRTPAQGLFAAEGSLPPLPPLPDVGLPAQTLTRRPDVASAYKAVLAADRRLAAAIADQYPKITLGAAAQTSAERVRDLFEDWLGRLAADAVGPLWDAGYRKAEVRKRKAVLSERIHRYGQTLLTALQEVEEALEENRSRQRLTENLRLQLDLARQVRQTTESKYLQGQLDYLRVLESLLSEQGLERQLLAAQRAQLERRIDLCRAIAGPWTLDEPSQ